MVHSIPYMIRGEKIIERRSSVMVTSQHYLVLCSHVVVVMVCHCLQSLNHLEIVQGGIHLVNNVVAYITLQFFSVSTSKNSTVIY